MSKIRTFKLDRERTNPIRKEDVIPEDTYVLAIQEHSKKRNHLDYFVPFYDINKFVSIIETIEDNLDDMNKYTFFDVHDVPYSKIRKTDSRGDFYCSVCKSIKEDSKYLKFFGRGASPIIHDECWSKLISEVKLVVNNNKNLIRKEEKKKVLSSL